MRTYFAAAIGIVAVVLVLAGVWCGLWAHEPAQVQRPITDSPKPVITLKLPEQTADATPAVRTTAASPIPNFAVNFNGQFNPNRSRKLEENPPAPKVSRLPQRTLKAGFHGKVIDEQGQPIPGVDVQIQGNSAKDVQAWRLERPVTRMPERVIHQTTSDGQGRFFLPDVTYRKIDVHEIAKQGYVLEPLLERTFSLGASSTKGVGQTADNPWIVKMWRRRGSPQPLITTDLPRLILEPTGEPRVISLVEPDADAGSESPVRLKLAIHRPEENSVVLRRDWSFSVESLDGEIAETDDPLTYEAPLDGYRPKWEWTVNKIKDPSLSGQVRKQLFVRTRDHKMYGRVFVDAYVYATSDRPTKCMMQIRSSVNPTGSRNLEPDPRQIFGSLKEYRDRGQSR